MEITSKLYIDDEADEAGIAYEELSYEEESEVVRVFAEWVIEQGKKMKNYDPNIFGIAYN